MGEGMAIGLDGMRRATVIGSRMAGLLGAVYTYTLPRSGIRYNLPGDRLTHLDGTPREAFVPPILVEETGDDAALARALSALSVQ
jgi:carboxyl-terminal processing protease